MDLITRKVWFTNQTNYLVRVRLAADILTSSYLKHEISQTNENRAVDDQFNSTKQDSRSHNSSTSHSDTGYKADGKFGGSLTSAVANVIGGGLSMAGYGGNFSNSTSASGSGSGIAGLSFTKANINDETKNASDVDNNSNTNSRNRICENKNSNYGLKETKSEWQHQARIGFSNLYPHQTEGIEVQTYKKNQSIYMTIYVPSMPGLRPKFICYSSVVNTKRIEIVFNQQRNEFMTSALYATPDFSRLMTHWGLQEYIPVMSEHGFDDIAEWPHLTDTILTDTFKFKLGHVLRFKRKLKERDELVLKPNSKSSYVT